MVDQRDRILQIVRMRGPVLPSQINTELKTNLLFASAMLSELVDKKALKITHLKVGGSPLYYAPGQEHRLQEYAGKLNEKDKRAFELLRQAKVLRDKDQEPLTRACLREIKDFAIPLEVDFEGNAELFWKWHLLPNEEVEPLVRQRLGLDKPKLEQPQTVPSDPLFEKKLELARKVMQEGPRRVEEKRKERDEAGRRPEAAKDDRARRQERREEKREGRQEERRDEKAEDRPLPEGFVDRGEPNDAFFRRIKAFFEESKIRILSHKVLRKESDIEFTIELPSAVGKLVYFCKAKDKQKLNDGDLSAAYVLSQSKKLPMLFLTTGELTKKAQDILSKEFKSMTVKRL